MEISIIREAGLLEKFYIARHNLGHESCTIVSAKYTADSASLSKPTLYPALAKLIQTHASLGVHLHNESTKRAAYARLQTVDLDKVVTFVDDDDVALVMEREFLRPFNTTELTPLWRAIVLKDNTVVFAYHHCITDGKSGVAFHKALASALNDPSTYSQDLSTNNISVPPIQLLPPVEKLLDLSVSSLTVIRELVTLFIPVSWTKASSAWTGNPVVNIPQLQTHCRIFHFSVHDSSQLLGLCHKHNSTLTSVFHTLALSTIAGLVANEIFSNFTPYTTIPSCIPISLRQLAHTPPDAMCNQISAFEMFSPITQTEFSWKEAATLASTLRSQVEKSKEKVGAIKFLFGNYNAFFKAMRGKKRKIGFELSNLGRAFWKVEPEDKWKTEKMVFALCAPVEGAAINLGVVGGPEGSISVSVTWGDNAVASSLVESFITEFRTRCSELIAPRQEE